MNRGSIVLTCGVCGWADSDDGHLIWRMALSDAGSRVALPVVQSVARNAYPRTERECVDGTLLVD